jgi:uncharacterized membrane protein YraQ (UPF0718 family)
VSFAAVVNILAVLALAVSYRFDSERTREALSAVLKTLKQLVPRILTIIGLIGLLLAFVPPETIATIFGDRASLLASLGLAVVGAVSVMPAPIAYPLAGLLKDTGAQLVGVAAFVSALTMVGFLVSPVEADIFGWRVVVVRNTINFLVVLSAALLMGVILL